MTTAASNNPRAKSRKRLTREESKAVTRSDVLEAAARVFAERGFHGASVEEVAETAGFSKGAVYSNFSSKEDLFLELLDQRLGSQLEAVAEVLESDEPLGRRLDALSRLPAPSLEQEDGNWCLLAIEFWLYAARNPEARKRLAARRRVMRRRVAEFIERDADAAGEPPSGLPEDLATLIIALGDGLRMQTYIEPAADSENLFRLAMGLILGTDPAQT